MHARRDPSNFAPRLARLGSWHYNPLMASAMVLAAGYATRLRPLSDVLPKPLVPVGDRALLAHVLAHLAAFGHQEVVANCYHLAALAERWQAPPATRLHWSREPELLGSAGGVAFARAQLPGSVLIWNGDIFAEPDLSALGEPLGDRFGRLLVADAASGVGNIGLDEQGCVVRLRGERFGVEVRSGDYVGVQFLSAQAVAQLPKRGCLFGDFALPALRAGARFASARHEGPWFDVGSPRGYLDANLHWLASRPGAWAAPDASIAPEVELVGSIVGSGARVNGAGQLVRSVVWPGASAMAPLVDSVVMPDGQVVSVAA